MRWTARAPAVLLSSALLLHRPTTARAERSEHPRRPVHATDTGTSPPYRAIRYLEDYAYLRSAPRREPWDHVKYLPLWSGGYLSFGGQHRLRSEYVDPVDVGVGPWRVSRSVILSRNLLHADLHLFERLRVFAQVGGFYALGGLPTHAEPPHADVVDVTQLFAEAELLLGEVRIVGRAGRQEMALGSARWVGARDGTNVRQAFDLLRVTVSRDGAGSIEMFFGTVPALRAGVFDDAPEWRDGFWGAYATIPVVPAKALGLDLFYLGRRRHEVEYGARSGREVRHTFGLRAFGETAFGLEYIEHAMVQVGSIDGSVDDERVLAWGLASALWQRLPGVLAPVRIGVRTEALSGDARPGDGRVTTFYPLFPNQSYFSALPAIYPTNLYDLHPLLRVEAGALTIEGGCAFFFRQAVEDAVYRPPGEPLVPGAASRGRYTGAQSSISLAYNATRHLAFNAEYAHLFAGPGLANGGGTDVDFFATWTTYTY